MPVTGTKEVVAALQHGIPSRIRENVEEALHKAAQLVLFDMEALTPIDASNPGPHARDGLTILAGDGGLSYDIGLPTRDLAEDHFWFRFLDGGTKGGEVSYRRNGRRFTMRVPKRPALRILERAMDGNRDEIERLIVQAIREALREGV
ncbi:hypothetical protein [Thalassospira xiamenensis]|uniref:hypothetical protein n=1 Tax=Thalassospira xiamenensis TaxID=220697 RepID=UPI000DED91CF|nr:hypothetical protein [Thalassospira xiamenensis]RCK40492.1 hypothetical protein TH24_11240 [Thalassospira xiamenensis]